MVRYKPVDYDPFAPASSKVSLKPVDFDPFAPKKKPTDFIDDMQRGAGQAIAAVGSALRDVPIKDISILGQKAEEYGNKVVQANPADMPSVQEIKSVGDALNFASERVAEIIPQAVAPLAAAGVATLAGAAAPVVGAASLGAGALSSFGQSYGGIREQQREQGIEDKARAAAFAAPSAALDILGVGRFVPGAGRVLGDIVETGLKGVAKTGARVGAEEGITEVAQTALERGGSLKSLTDEEAQAEYLNALAAGVVGGGGIGAGGAAVRTVTGQPTPEAEPGTEPPPPPPAGEPEAGLGVPATPFGAPPASEPPPSRPAGETVTIEDDEVTIEYPDGRIETIPREEWDARQKAAAPPVETPAVESVTEPVAKSVVEPAADAASASPPITLNRDEAFLGLANQQRDRPESAMVAAQMDDSSRNLPSYNTYTFLLEHVGDLTNRMANPIHIGKTFGKLDSTLRVLSNEVDADRMAKIPITPQIKEYADAHAALPVYNEAQRLARDAAVALGRLDFNVARENLTALKAMENAGVLAEESAKYDPKFETQPAPAPAASSAEPVSRFASVETPSGPIDITPPKGSISATPIEDVEPITPEQFAAAETATAEIQKMIAGKTMPQVARELGQNSVLDTIRAFMPRVANILDAFENAGVELRIGVQTKGKEGVPGLTLKTKERGMASWRPWEASMNVALRGMNLKNPGVSESILAHELIHAVTMLGIDFENRLPPNSEIVKAVKDLKALSMLVAKRMREDQKAGRITWSNKYRIYRQDPNEILAWGLTDSNFQEYLKTITTKTGNAFTDFVRYIGKLLGVAPKDQNALARLIEISDRIIPESQAGIADVTAGVVASAVGIGGTGGGTPPSPPSPTPPSPPLPPPQQPRHHRHLPSRRPKRRASKGGPARSSTASSGCAWCKTLASCALASRVSTRLPASSIAVPVN